MIERLLAGEAALGRNELDAADRLFTQVADADPRNAIALAGRARVALRRGERHTALVFAEQALILDPDEAAARRLVAELDVPPASPSLPPTPVSPSTPQPASAPNRVAVPGRRTGWREWLHRLLRRS